MKEWLLKDLVCPDCLPGEHLLKLEEVEKKHGDDILEAALRCPVCGQIHPIAEGVAMVVFSDPFSWDAKISPPEAWLGGTDCGPYAGRGPAVVGGILAGDHGIFSPPLTVEARDTGRSFTSTILAFARSSVI